MSPIKGISELVRLPRLGKLHLGIKKTSEKTGNPYPVATDFFVCPKEIQAIYGEQPKELKIMFPLEDEEKFASQWLKCYSNLRGLICRGNGETAIALVDTSTGEIATREAEKAELKEITCNPEECERYGKKQCRQLMCLQFLLPEVPGFGVWQCDTTSFNSIRAVNSSIRLIKSICGRISMIPLSLKLVPLDVSPEGKKKTVHILQLTANYTIQEMVKYSLMSPGQALLPEPLTEPPDDLYPEEVIEELELKEQFHEAGGTPPKVEVKEAKDEPKAKGKDKVKETLLEMGAKPVVVGKISMEEPKKAPQEPTWKLLGFFSLEEQNSIRNEIYGQLVKFLPPKDHVAMGKFCSKPSVEMTKEELIALLGKAHAGWMLSTILKDEKLDPAEFFKKQVGKERIEELSIEEIGKLTDALSAGIAVPW